MKETEKHDRRACRRSDWGAYRGQSYREAHEPLVTHDEAGVWDADPTLLSLEALLLTGHDLMDQLETEAATARWTLESLRDGRHSRIEDDEISNDNESLAGLIVRLTALVNDITAIRRMVGVGREDL